MKNSRVVPLNEIKQTQIFQANAFVAKGCTGNPAGICLLPQSRDAAYYRKVAIKMDMSETAFVVWDNGIYNLRWFTRGGNEVSLCGHATLATSYILYSKGYVDTAKPIYYKTKSGVLSASKQGAFITLDFPRYDVKKTLSNKVDFAAALGVKPLYVGQTEFDNLVLVENETTVKNLEPDFNRLKKISNRGVMVTAKSENKSYDFVSRFFAPSIGIDEDPVTGSAHCALGPYWSGVLGKNDLVGYQASKQGGMVKVTVLKDRVLVGGEVKEMPLPATLKNGILSY